MPLGTSHLGFKGRHSSLDTYKDSAWLYEERYKQRRTAVDIATECGVDRKTVEYFIAKYHIPVPLRDKDILVEIACSCCKDSLQKPLRYLKQRVRKQNFLFYCKPCLAEMKRGEMAGSGNPNFGGTFHGETPDKWCKEKRKAATEKMLATRLANKSLHAHRNGRWAGGARRVSCIICGNAYDVRPYVYRQIDRGTRKPCCTKDCARLYALTQVKTARTSIEVKMAKELSRRTIIFIEQYNLGNKFALDFFLPDYGIVIECDGDYWHRRPEVVGRDKSKNAYIRACGYTLFRFWESDINASVEACVDLVLAEINAREVS